MTNAATANAWFAQVQEYLTRFESIPDMLELDHLTVSGDVTFGKNVSLKVSAQSILISSERIRGEYGDTHWLTFKIITFRR